MPEGELQSELTEDSGFVYLAKLVDNQVAEAVANLNLPGINLLSDPERVDPALPLASPLMGTSGADGNGQSGLEYQYESLLSGESGTLTDEEAPSGVVLPDAPVSGSAGKDGDGIELTLDEPLQYMAENALRNALLTSHAVSGTVILMNVHTGDILAMANLVANTKTHVVSEAQQNLALTSVYEPGSVFKLVTFSAALQARIITPSSELVIPPSMTIDGSVFHDSEQHPTERLRRRRYSRSHRTSGRSRSPSTSEAPQSSTRCASSASVSSPDSTFQVSRKASSSRSPSGDRRTLRRRPSGRTRRSPRCRSST